MNASTGRCLCGNVSCTGLGARGAIHVCHCETCRRWSGGPSINIGFSDGIAIDEPDAVNWFQSSEWAERGSCRGCGSALFYRLLTDPASINVSVGSLDDDRNVGVIHEHIFSDSKPVYYNFTDTAPRITGAEIIARFTSGEESGS